MKAKTVLMAFSLAVAGCGGSGSTLTCDTTAGIYHYCQTYSKDGVTGASCGEAATGDSMKVAGCPTANKLGTCTYTQTADGNTETVTTIFYSDQGETTADAEGSCTAFAGSTWTPAG
jgi:hypothetical protein